MKHEDFKIHAVFTYGKRKWLVTDVGTRTIIAICILPASRKNDWFRSLPEDALNAACAGTLDVSWFKGPPYALEEHVFIEEDFEECNS